MKRFAIAVVLATALSAAAAADDGQGYKTFSKTGSFAEVRDDLKDAIINRGLVIDYVGQFNNMLKRTSEAAGSVTETGAKSPYRNAEFVQFCPSKLTHELVSIDPRGIANCPIALFVYELRYEPGKITVGYRLPISGPSKRMKQIGIDLEAVLHGIAAEATKK